MTVGELVQERVGVVLPTVFKELTALCALVDLGIWDAEVLDKRVEEDDFGDYALSHLTQAEARRAGLRYGQSVRVIVLKGE